LLASAGLLARWAYAMQVANASVGVLLGAPALLLVHPTLKIK